MNNQNLITYLDDSSDNQITASSLSDLDNFFKNYIKRDTPCSPNGMVNAMLTHLLGCIMSERDEIRSQVQIPMLFFSRLKARIERKEDTGLLPQGMLKTYYLFTENEQKEIMSELEEAVKSLSKMPNPGKMIVLESNKLYIINILGKDYTLEVPAIVQTNTGAAIIAPVWTPKDNTNSTYYADIYGLIDTDSSGRKLSNSHVWDIRESKFNEYSLDNINDVKLLMKKYTDK